MSIFIGNYWVRPIPHLSWWQNPYCCILDSSAFPWCIEVIWVNLIFRCPIWCTSIELTCFLIFTRDMPPTFFPFFTFRVLLSKLGNVIGIFPALFYLNKDSNKTISSFAGSAVSVRITRYKVPFCCSVETDLAVKKIVAYVGKELNIFSHVQCKCSCLSKS